MNTKTPLVGFCTFLAVACSAAGSPEDASLGNGSPAPTVAPTADCGFAGPRTCFCPDGTQSGTQTCAAGVLSSCVCPPGGAGPASLPPSNDPTQVCADLRGSSACNATSYVSEEVPSSILFVLDRTGTMGCNPPPLQTTESCESLTLRADPAQPSKWEITTQAMNGVFSGLSGDSASIGLSLFSNDDFCGVDSAPSVELAPMSAVQAQALSEAMTAVVPGGGTPLVGSVIVAYHHLHEELHASGNRFVVLITDGQENCGTKGDPTDAADIEAARARLLNVEVGKAREANIKTFVVGVPGSEAERGFLSQLAFLGGTARDPNCIHDGSPAGNCHFDLTSEADFAGVLQATLGKIGGKALGCEFKAPPGGNGLVNVQFSRAGGEPVCFPQDPAPCDGGSNGWQFAKDPAGNDDTTRVVLCGAACETVKADPTTRVDVILGCPMIH